MFWLWYWILGIIFFLSGAFIIAPNKNNKNRHTFFMLGGCLTLIIYLLILVLDQVSSPWDYLPRYIWWRTFLGLSPDITDTLK